MSTEEKKDKFPLILTISLLSSVILAVLFHILNIEFSDKTYDFLKNLFFEPLKIWVYPVIAVAMFSVFFRSPQGQASSFLVLITDIIILYTLSTFIANIFAVTTFNFFDFANTIKPLLDNSEVTNFNKTSPGGVPTIIWVMLIGLVSSFIFRFVLNHLFAILTKPFCSLISKFLCVSFLKKLNLFSTLEEEYELACQNKDDLDYSLSFINFTDRVIFLILMAILLLAPFAVFASFLGTLNERGFTFFYDLGRFISFYAAILFSYQFLVMPLLRNIFCFGLKRESYKSFLIKALPVMATAGTTSSSVATLATNIKAAQSLDVEEDMKYRGHNRALMPIGATFNMDGTSISLIIYFLVAAQLSGIEISYWMVILTAIGLSVGTAAVPSASLIILTSMFSAFAIPVTVTSKLLTIILAVDPIHDRIRTIVNTWGDLNMVYIVQSKRGPLTLFKKLISKKND